MPPCSPDMPGGVLFFWPADRKTLDLSIYPGNRRDFTGVRPPGKGRDPDAGTALRRGQRGRQLRCPRGPRTERAVHPADRRAAAGGRSRPDLPARPVRDRSGESVATQGDPGTNPGRRDGRRDRRCCGDPGRARALVRGPGPGPRLGDIVTSRLTAAGTDPGDGQWDSRKRGDGNWQVSLAFPSGGRLHVAEWVFDPRRRHVMPDDDNAARLSLPESELPPEPVSMPGEATVTPIASRLGAAAGMGGGGFAAGPTVSRFRPERSVIPDRSLGADRSLADRPAQAPLAAPERSVAVERSATAERSSLPERTAGPERSSAPE